MINKKLVASAFALYLLGTHAAFAQLDVQLNLGQPAYVVQQPAVYVSPYPTYYDPRHRGHDAKYWQERRKPQGHEEHHERDGGHEHR